MDQIKTLKEQYTEVSASTKQIFNREKDKLTTIHQKELQLYHNEVSQLKSQIFKADKNHSKEVLKLTMDKKELTKKPATTKCTNLEIDNQQSTINQIKNKSNNCIQRRKNERKNESVKKRAARQEQN